MPSRWPVALFEDKNVILNNLTGSGKSLVASALHFDSLARNNPSVYTCPIKALPSGLRCVRSLRGRRRRLGPAQLAEQASQLDAGERFHHRRDL